MLAVLLLGAGLLAADAPDSHYAVIPSDADAAKAAARAERQAKAAAALQAINQAVQENMAEAEKPIDVFVLVLNPHDMAVKKEGALTVAVGDMAASFGLCQTVDAQVWATIDQDVTEKFVAQGIAVDVSDGMYTVQATNGLFWSGAQERLAQVSAGPYHLLRIVVQNPAAAAQAHTSAAKATIGSALGVVPDMVREKVEEKVYGGLVEKGAKAVVLHLALTENVAG